VDVNMIHPVVIVDVDVDVFLDERSRRAFWSGSRSRFVHEHVDIDDATSTST
jgi:hypothetical protein